MNINKIKELLKNNPNIKLIDLDLPTKINVPPQYIKSILERNVDDKYYLKQSLIDKMVQDKDFNKKINLTEESKILKIYDKSITGKKSQGSAVYHYNGLMSTLNAGTHGYSMGQILENNNPIKVRKLTPLECERLMGWPDNWTKYGVNSQEKLYELSDTARYKAIGNGITSIIPKILLEHITNKKKEYLVFSTFSGVDGSCLSLPKDNFRIVAFSEYDPKNKKEQHAANVLKYHYPQPNLGDITQLIPENVPEHDIIFISAPCQSFSIAGKRAGLDDTRGTLFYETARIMKEKKPQFFVFENVKGLLSHDGGKTFQIMCEIYSSLGYHLDFNIFNSKDFGLAQSRERLFMIGVLKE